MRPRPRPRPPVAPLMLRVALAGHTCPGLQLEGKSLVANHGCQSSVADGPAGGGPVRPHIAGEAVRHGGEVLVPLDRQHRPAAGHPRAQVPAYAQLPLPSHRQAEEQQRGLH